jgi:hypothetical protein
VAEIVKEFSFSDYAIDDNLSRHTWKTLSGIDGMLLVVVVGEGKLVVPVDFAIRRPDPTGPGAPCRDKLHWLQGMLDGRVAAFRRRGVELPPPLVVADSWFSDSKLMRHVAITHEGTLLVEGKSTDTVGEPCNKFSLYR